VQSTDGAWCRSVKWCNVRVHARVAYNFAGASMHGGGGGYQYSSMIVRLLGARGQHQWTNDAHVTHVVGQKKDEVWPSRSALWRSPSRRAANSSTELQHNQCPEGTECSMRPPERRSPHHGRSLVRARCASSCCTRCHHCFGVAEPRHTATHPRHRPRAVYGGVCCSFEVAHKNNCTF